MRLLLNAISPRQLEEAVLGEPCCAKVMPLPSPGAAPAAGVAAAGGGSVAPPAPAPAAGSAPSGPGAARAPAAGGSSLLGALLGRPGAAGASRLQQQGGLPAAGAPSSQPTNGHAAAVGPSLQPGSWLARLLLSSQAAAGPVPGAGAADEPVAAAAVGMQMDGVAAAVSNMEAEEAAGDAAGGSDGEEEGQWVGADPAGIAAAAAQLEAAAQRAVADGEDGAAEGLQGVGGGARGSPLTVLVTPKLRALVRQLLPYKGMAEGPAGKQAGDDSSSDGDGQPGECSCCDRCSFEPTGAACFAAACLIICLQCGGQQVLGHALAACGADGAQGGASAPSSAATVRPCWSAIVFVTQRMAAWGLHCALRSLPCLAFLRTSAIMGAGARVGEGYGVQEQVRAGVCVGRAVRHTAWG